jgi:hypothetical protein
LFGLLASSAFAAGIKHPSDYGDVSGSIDFLSCGSTTVGLVVADCFTGANGTNDFLFTLSLASPTPLISITSVEFTLADVPTDVGFLQGDPSDCAAMNISCTPSQIGISGNNPPFTSPITLNFSNFTGDLSATIFFAYGDTATKPVFTADQTGASVATPEPTEIGILIAAFGCLVAARRKLLVK